MALFYVGKMARRVYLSSENGAQTKPRALNHARFPQLTDALPVVSQDFGQHLFGVLPEQRRGLDVEWGSRIA